MKRLAIAVVGAIVACAVIYATAYVYFQYLAYGRTDTCREIARWPLSTAPGTRTARHMGLAWRAGLLYVTDADNGIVERYRSDGTLESRWSGFERPVAVAPTDAAVYVADFLADRVVTLDVDGTVIGGFGQQGSGPGAFDAVGGVAVDQTGNIYASDFYNHRIQKFDPDGRFLREWGKKGRTSGRFQYPTGIAISAQGEIVVADAFNNRVQVFTSDGQYLRQWGGVGFGFGGAWPGWFRLAKEVAVDAAGSIYVADAFNGRIQTFTPEGTLLALWDPGSPALRYATGIAVADSGIVYVSDFYDTKIRQLRCE